jgi:hypothetical protein
MVECFFILTSNQAHSKSITLLQTFKGAFVVAGSSDGCVSIWTFDFEEAFSSGRSNTPNACSVPRAPLNALAGQILKDAVVFVEIVKVH